MDCWVHPVLNVGEVVRCTIGQVASRLVGGGGGEGGGGDYTLR